MTEEEIKEYVLALSNFDKNTNKRDVLIKIRKLLDCLKDNISDDTKKEIKHLIRTILSKSISIDLKKQILKLPNISSAVSGQVSLLENISDEGLLKAMMFSIKPALMQYDSEETVSRAKESIANCFGGKPNRLFLFLIENRGKLDEDLKNLLIENLISQRPFIEKLVVYGLMPLKLSLAKRMNFAGKYYRYGKIEKALLKKKAKTSLDKFKVFVTFTSVDDLIPYYREHDLEMTRDEKRILFQKIISKRKDIVEELIERDETFDVITDSMPYKERERFKEENVIEINHLKDLSVDEARKIPNLKFIGIKCRK